MAALGVVLATVVPVAPAAAAGPAVVGLDMVITDAAGNPLTTHDPSAADGYYVRYSYTCSVAPCTGTQITIPATPLDPYYNTYRMETGFVFTPPFAGATATGAVGTGITVNLGNLAPSVGTFTIYYNTGGRPLNAFLGGSFFPPGYQIPQSATISSTNSDNTDGASASVTWGVHLFDPALSLTTTPATSTRTDLNVTVGVSAPSGCIQYHWQTTGHRGWEDYLCAASWTTTVQLPPNAQYVAGSGGTYDAVARTVTFSASGNTFDAGRGNYGKSFQVLFSSASYPTSGAGCQPTETFTATHVTTFLEGTVKNTSATKNLVVQNCAPFAAASFDGKGVTRSAGTAASPILYIPATGGSPTGGYWAVTVRNKANVDGVGTITDTQLDQPGMPVYRVRVTAGGPGTINVTLDNGTTASSTTGTYTAPAGRRIVSATVTSAVLAGPNATSGGSLTTPFQVLYDFSVPDTASPGARTNTATARMAYPSYPGLSPIDYSDSESVTLQAAPVVAQLPGLTAIAGGAVVAGGGIPVAGSTVTWTMRGSVGNAPNNNVVVPQYIYVAPEHWDITGVTFNTNPPAGYTQTLRTVTIAGVTRNAVVVTWPGPITIPASGTSATQPTMTVTTKPLPSAPAGTNNNVASVFFGDAAHAESTYSPATYTDVTDIDGDGITTEKFALASPAISMGATLSAAVKKEICQPDADEADGCNWISDPSIQVGVPPTATAIKYRVTITNTGNTALTNVLAYDVLPFVGDPRGSDVQEVVETAAAPGDVVLSYSANTNTSGPWTAPQVGASAIRATIASLAYGQSRTFTYTASLVGAAADKTACNSVSVQANSLPVFEPSPVCATTQEADFRVETADRLPLQEGRVGTVPFVVTNGGGSQSASGVVTLSLPPELSIVDLTIPGWDCTAPSMTGPVDVECVPVNPDSTTRSLLMDASETIPLKVLPAAGSDLTQLCIDAVIAGLIYDPNLENNERTSCSTLYSGTELDVSKTDGLSVASPGETLTYTITAANLLVAEAATGATIVDTLPSNVKFVSASNGGVLSGADADGYGGIVTWPAVNLTAAGTANASGSNGSGAAGSAVTRTVTVEVAPTATGEIANLASLTAPDPASPTTQLQAQGDDVDALQRLTVTKSSNAAAAGVRTGDVVTYTVTLTNDGTADYTLFNPARLVDDLSGVLDDATFVAGSATASVDGGAAAAVGNPVSQRLSWSGSLASGSSVTVIYQVTVGVGASGDVLTNTAYAAATPSSCTNGLTPSDASCATLTTQFAPTLAKVVTSSAQNDDGTWTIVYSVLVTNTSPVVAATYTLSDSIAFGSGITVLNAAVTAAPAGVTPAPWSGTGTIATAVGIPASSQHVYQLTVVADAGTTGGTPAGTCATGVAGGFANRATLTTTDGRTAAAEACAAPAEPTVDKTVAPATQLPDGRWSLEYTVTVSNTAAVELPYTLDDVLGIPAGITIDDLTVTGPIGAPVNGSFDGTGTTALLTGVDRIPAGSTATPSTRVYTIALIVDAAQAGGAGISALTCPPAGTGGYANAVSLRAGTGATVLDSATACTNALPLPTPEISKRVISTTVDAGGVWTIEYDIAVTNPDPAYSTRYSLTDELQFAAGVSIVSAEVSSSSATASGTWDGESDTVVSTDQALGAEETHRYTVTVAVDPGAFDTESAAADCRLDTGEAGTGFSNLATVTSGVESVFSAACEPITDPSAVKTVVDQPTQDADTGVWTVQYEITVKNRSTTTVGDIPYELTDELDFPTGVEVVDVDVDAPDGITPNSGFDGDTDTTIAAAGIGAATSDTEPATHVYTVTVQFTVPAGLQTGTQCDPAQGPGGLFNEVEIAVGSRVSGAVACANAPDVPLPGLTKTVLSQEQQGDGTWVVLYGITVANPSNSAASEYTLDDAFALGDGITIVGTPTIESAPAGVTTEPDFDGDNATTIAEEILLPAAGSHTYTVRAVIDSGSVTGDEPAGDCVLDVGEAGTGFRNVATLDTGVTTSDIGVCAQAWDPGVTKELNGQPVQQADGSWLLSYTMTVTNPSLVALTYGLVDELDFPAGTDITIESAAARPGSPAVEPDWDGQTQIQLVADGTPLPPNATHVFDVTVRAVLPEDQDSQPGGWGNTATVESGVGGVITTDAEATADILLPELVIAKAVTVDDPVLRIGDEVDYEITIENVGQGDFTALSPAVVWDDLSDVLDDADLTAGPTATPDIGTVVPIGGRFQWSAALLSGDSVTLAYTVTITGGGNAELVNVAFVSLAAVADPPTPPAGGCTGTTCALTTTAMPALDIQKSVSATTTTQGEVIQYTVELTNTGGVDLTDADPARMTDDLSDVLDNATYNVDAEADSGTISFAFPILSWEGPLAAGETVTITYSVTVNSNAPNGARLENVALSDPTLATLALGGTDTPGAASTTTTIVALAATGTDPVWAAGLAALLLLLGGKLLFLVVSVRRRRADARLPV